MKLRTNIADNKGFSLIELIAIVAIMAVMIGMGSLSISLLTGSEAKQAAEKIGAHLDEAKTGSMSRYSEDLNIVYVSNPDDYDWADKEGYYAVMQMTTLASTPSGMPTEVSIGSEHRYLCNDRVNMTLTSSGAGTYNVSTTGGIGFMFDRTTGLYSDIRMGCTLDPTGAVTGSGAGALPDSLEVKSGMKTYTIKFYNETGKHQIQR